MSLRIVKKYPLYRPFSNRVTYTLKLYLYSTFCLTILFLLVWILLYISLKQGKKYWNSTVFFLSFRTTQMSISAKQNQCFKNIYESDGIFLDNAYVVDDVQNFIFGLPQKSLTYAQQRKSINFIISLEKNTLH